MDINMNARRARIRCMLAGKLWLKKIVTVTWTDTYPRTIRCLEFYLRHKFYDKRTLPEASLTVGQKIVLDNVDGFLRVWVVEVSLVRPNSLSGTEEGQRLQGAFPRFWHGHRDPVVHVHLQLTANFHKQLGVVVQSLRLVEEKDKIVLVLLVGHLLDGRAVGR